MRREVFMQTGMIRCTFTLLSFELQDRIIINPNTLLIIYMTRLLYSQKDQPGMFS